MIISASRRTDIPAFFGDWFSRRIKAEYCLVPNPYNTKQISKVSLRLQDVDAIVFWSKNPAPFFKNIPMLTNIGYRYYFQYTVNDYPWIFEPKIPPLTKRINTFKKLSDLIGKSRVIWRYDPIIISNATTYDYHRSAFLNLCKELSPYTNRVIISLIDYYRKTKQKLKHLENKGIDFDYNIRTNEKTLVLLKELALLAKSYGLEIFTCGEEGNYRELGISPGCCIDGELIARLWDLKNTWKKDPGQREACLCVVSKDIGMTDTCLHGCPYCYSTISDKVAAQRNLAHDPQGPALVKIESPPVATNEPNQLDLL